MMKSKTACVVPQHKRPRKKAAILQSRVVYDKIFFTVAADGKSGTVTAEFRQVDP
jgi:hypothetical protein